MTIHVVALSTDGTTVTTEQEVTIPTEEELAAAGNIGPTKGVIRPGDPIPTETTFIDRIDSVIAGWTSGLTGGITDDVREWWWGDVATRNHSGLGYTIGKVGGTVHGLAIVVMGVYQFTASVGSTIFGGTTIGGVSSTGTITLTTTTTLSPAVPATISTSAGIIFMTNAGGADAFVEFFDTFGEAIGDLNPEEAKIIEVVKTKNKGAIDQGFTEKVIGEGSEGGVYSAFRNPKTGKYTGGKPSSHK